MLYVSGYKNHSRLFALDKNGYFENIVLSVVASIKSQLFINSFPDR
jgi:hypothetical protein